MLTNCFNGVLLILRLLCHWVFPLAQQSCMHQISATTYILTFGDWKAETLCLLVSTCLPSLPTILLLFNGIGKRSKSYECRCTHVGNQLQAKPSLSEIMFYGGAAPFRFVQEENHPCFTQIHMDGQRWGGWMWASQGVRPTLLLILLPWLHTSALWCWKVRPQLAAWES